MSEREEVEKEEEERPNHRGFGVGEKEEGTKGRRKRIKEKERRVIEHSWVNHDFFVEERVHGEGKNKKKQH